MSDGNPYREDGERRDAGRSARGFSTRAIAAASRAPRLEQTPTSVPIDQTATFSTSDAELTASLGSVHTMVVHPPSTSHRQTTEADLLAAGITPGLLRVWVGLEDPEDLQADVAAALDAIPATLGADRASVPALGGT